MSTLLNVSFFVFLIVIFAHFLATRIFAESATSKLRTLSRIIFVFFYMVFIFNLSSLFQAVPNFLNSLYGISIFQTPFGVGINIIFSLILFPFSGGYIITVTIISLLISPNTLHNLVLGSTIIGGLMLVIADYYISKKGIEILENLGLRDDSGVKARDEIHEEVIIQSNKPRTAYMKTSLQIASRTYSGLFALLTPLIFSLLGLFTGIAALDNLGEFFDPFLFLVFYSGITPTILKTGLFAAEENLGGLLSMLPVRQRDLYRARQFLMTIIMSLPVVVTWGFQISIRQPLFFLSGLTVLFLNIVISMAFLQLHSLFFGRINRNYTVYMVNLNRSVIKNVSLIILSNVIIFVTLFWNYWITDSLNLDLFIGLFVSFTIIILLLEVTGRRMFI